MKSFEEQVKEWEGKANFVTPIPNIGEIPDIFKATISTIKLNSDIKGDDIYTASQKKEYFNKGKSFNMVPDVDKCRLSADAIKTLAQLAGIEWEHASCGIVKRTDDAIYYQVVAGIRKPNGEFYKPNSVYEKNLKVIRDNLHDTHLSEKAFKTWSGYSNNKKKARSDFKIEGQLKIDKDMRRNRGFITQLAETGAKVRVIKELLLIKKEYTQEELKLPFLAIKIVIDYNSKNPILQAALISGLVESTNSLFGKVKQIKELPDYRENEPIQEAELEDKPPETPEVTPSIDFANSDIESQFKTIQSLSEKKKYDFNAFLERCKCAFKDLSAEKRIDLFDRINKLEDDDIPF